MLAVFLREWCLGTRGSAGCITSRCRQTGAALRFSEFIGFSAAPAAERVVRRQGSRMTHVNTPEEERRLFDWFEATTGRAWDSLSEVESAVWKAYLFDLAVQNGGFDKGLLD